MTRDTREEIDGLRATAQDLQRRIRRLEEIWSGPDFFTSEQIEAMIGTPEPVARRIAGEGWEGYDETQRAQTVRLVKAIGELLQDAPPGSQVGLHVAGGIPYSWVREPRDG